jgi:DNA polymerase-3 subunit delta'
VIHAWNQARHAQLMGDRDHLPHALLLHGPAGVGKSDLALALAKGLLCEAPQANGACGVCDACNWFEQGNHPDFRRVEPGENDTAEEAEESEKPAKPAKPTKRGGRLINVEAVREITQFLSLSAHRGGWRVALVQPAELMNTAAANALLKTLEEPPQGVLLILVSHQIGRLLPTVVSRCRKVHVGLPTKTEALAWLRQQGVEGAQALLAEAGGAPLAAMAFADPERAALRERFLDHLAAFPHLDVCAVAQSFQAVHVDAWGWLLRWVQDLLSQSLAGAPRYFVERGEQTARIGRGADLAALLALQRELLEAGRWLRHPLQTQLLLESWLIRYVQIAGARA